MEGLLPDAIGRCVPVTADATDAEDMTQLLQWVQEHYTSLQVLINNVGGIDRPASFENLPDEDWASAYDVNVVTAVRTIRLSLPLMKTRGGSVVNIASFVSTRPGDWNPQYSSAKAALVHLTKHLARRYASEGIRFNVVSPGHVETDGWRIGLRERAKRSGVSEQEVLTAEVARITKLVPMGRMATAEEVAAAVSFLVSGDSSYITGMELSVDGGRTL
jgi:3-oxoacyl-[acyl-carrier protein] reductase